MFINCASQIRQDLGTVLPSGWADTQIANWNGYVASPVFVSFAGAIGGWSDAGVTQSIAIGSVSGWRDAGAASAPRGRLGLMVGGAR